MEYFSYGVEDFALYLPNELIPSRRVLVLRYKNRFDTLVQSLVMRGVNVTSAYPVTWMRKDWNAQEERMAKEVDGECHRHCVFIYAIYRPFLSLHIKQCDHSLYDQYI